MFVRILVLMLLLSLSASAVAQDEPAPPEDAPKRIGVVLDGAAPRGAALLAESKRELLGFTGDKKVAFPADKTLVGDWSATTARANVAQLLADPEVDMVWAFGVLASDAAAHTTPIDKPTLAPFVLDEKLQGIKRGAKPNLSYVLWSPNIRRDLMTLQDFGDIKRVTFLVNGALKSALPKLAAHAKSAATALGLEMTIVPVGTDPRQALAAIPRDTHAAYLGPNLQLTQSDIDVLAAGFIARNLPSFSYLGRSEVERGLLVGLGSAEDGARMARLIALNSDAMLRGEQGSSLTTAFKMEERPVINMKTARAIGLHVPSELSSVATLLDAHRPRAKRRLTLARVAAEVLARNLDLKANARGLQAAERSIDEAQGALLPRLDASLSADWIDPDGATARTPERSMTWSATLSQSIFDEASWSSVTVRQHVRNATKHSNDSSELDAIRAATVAYLNVLSAKTAERIQGEDLKSTREHLAFARVRVKLGTGRQSEILRFETSLVAARTNLLTSVANRHLAEIELNRLLNRPLEEPFDVADVSLDDSQLMAGGELLSRYMADERRFELLRSFLVEEGVRNAPELKALSAQIAAKKREESSHALAPFVPSLRASASMSHRFLQDGQGTEVTAVSVFDPNPFNWQVGVTATLPLYQGNARYARTQRSGSELRQLELQRQSNKQMIRKNVLTTLHQANASLRAIRLTRRASKLARQNLELVVGAYAQGDANITELLDAQNQAVIADFSANTSVYTFLVDLMNVQRSTGRFEFAMGQQDVAAFFSRLGSYERRHESPEGPR